MKFKILKQSDGVRIGKLDTAHGSIETPFFMPVGTLGSVKGISPRELREIGAQIVLSNTYHLYLRPGEQLIKGLGGLHSFMGWDGPILTDSGGYQVFSLGKKLDNNQTNSKFQISNLRHANNDCHSELDSDSISNGSQVKTGMTKRNLAKSLVKITEEGVEFTSHLDGSKHFFTPEKVIDIQLDLGVNILMPLDVCPSGKASKHEIEEAVRLTILWAERSKKHFDEKIAKLLNCYIAGEEENNKNRRPNNTTIQQYNNRQPLPALFGIVQGGLDPELRKYCAEELIKLDFDGYSIGGLAVDHETRDMWKTVKLMGEILPEDKPRYLMGVGTPDDILKAVRLGVDMFDCVLPTRLARHGSVFVRKQQVESGKSKVESGMRLTPADPLSFQPDVIASEAKQSGGDLPANKFVLINLLNSKYRTDGGVIEEGCDCPACSGGYSCAYISHLIRNNEMYGLRLATLHNLRQYLRLMESFRK